MARAENKGKRAETGDRRDWLRKKDKFDYTVSRREGGEDMGGGAGRWGGI